MLNNYNIEIQKLFIRMMVSNAELYTRVSNIVNSDNFDKTLRPVMAAIVEHVNKYNVIPEPNQIYALTNVEIEPIPDLEEGHYNWFLEEFEQFTKRQELERAILKSADMLEKGEYGPVEKIIKDAVQISLQKDMGTDYFANPKERIHKYFNAGGQVSTGWAQMDKLLYGGFSRGELNIFAGGSGCVTEDTLVEIVELIDLLQFYTLNQINAYTKNDTNKLIELYNLSQPKKVPIVTLMDKIKNSHIVVKSPDGWVPVTDCIEKVKDNLYCFIFQSGRKIIASHDHLYQTPDQKWHFARDLVVGDNLLSESGPDPIIKIDNLNKKTKVYDLSVNHPNHRYYTNGICSHNSGKSLIMMNIAANWLQMGLSGVYISLELSEELTALRTDAMLTSKSTRDIRKDVDDTSLKIRMCAKKSGKYRIKGMPAQSNSNDIRAYLKEVQIQTGIKIDFVMVDYLDLLMPVSVKVNPSDLFIKDKYVGEELRNLAKELNVLMVTASQLNRSAVEEIEFDHSHIAGGISKIHTADNVFGIFTSRSMRERGKYQLQCMKSRSSVGVGSKIDLEYDVETMRITDENPDNYSTANKEQSSSASILSKIKTSSTVLNQNPDKTLINNNTATHDQEKKLKLLLNSLKQGSDQ